MRRYQTTVFLIAAMFPFIAFLFVFYAEHNLLKADVNEWKNERVRITEKLDKISEKLNIIDGKISEMKR